MSKKVLCWKSLITFFLLFIMSIVFGIVYFQTTNPIYNNPGADSLCFSLIGRGMIDGMVPYRDFIDNKGLVLYSINALSQFVFPYEIFSSFGIWITEILLLFITLIYIRKIVMLLEVRCPFIIQLAFLFCFSVFIEGGNLCEEYGVHFSVIGMYYVLKYIKQDAQVNHLLYSFVVGLMFMLCFFTRPNNALPIFIMIFGVLIYLLSRKKYNEILKCIIGFLISVVVVLAPMLIYLIVNDALYDCFIQSFMANLAYSSVSGGVRSLLGTKYFLCAIVLFVITTGLSIMYIIKHKNSTNKVFIGAITIVSGLVGLWSSVISGYDFMHYLMIPLIPAVIAFVFGGDVFLGMFTKMRSRMKLFISYSLLIVILIGIFALGIPSKMYEKVEQISSNISTYIQNGYLNDKQKEILEIYNQIPPEDRHSICMLAPIKYNYFFLYSKTYPCYRLFVCHKLFNSVIPGLEEEYDLFMKKTPPKFIILTKDNITEELKNKYTQFSCYENGLVMIWKLK